ncbi:MAG TPA: hypothetical protein VD794_10220 [Flavisolibacter sp.]|nr:hypothetical protein [Flavisolibacter sp.]
MKNLSFTLVVAILAFLLGCMITCNCNKGKTVTKTDVKTVTKRDTTIQVIKDTMVIEKPVPVRVNVPQLGRVDSFFQELPVDSAAIVAHFKPIVSDYMSQKVYKEKYQFKEGRVDVETIVKENAITSQKVMPTFFQTTIKETTTTTQPPRNSVWVGIDGMYRDSTIGVGASLMFQSKRGWALEAGAAINEDLSKQFRASYKRRLFK